MNPTSTLRFRRATAALAVGWALLALGLSLSARVYPPDLGPPFDFTQLAGVSSVQWASDEAQAAGLQPGDRVLSVDGGAFVVWLRREGIASLRAGVPKRYLLERRDGSRYEAVLEPTPVESSHLLEVPLFLALLAVGGIYLCVGMTVWGLRSERAESWALLLFCSCMAMQLFSATETLAQPWVYERLMINFGLLGGTSFHLFTLYPTEPGWIVRHRGIRLVPYGIGLLIGALAVLERPLGVPPGLLAPVGFFFAVGAALLCAGIVTVERFRVRDPALAMHADVVLLGFGLSFLPVIGLLLAQIFLRTTFPVPVALLWFGTFPLAIAYGVVRRELFDIRILARSSVGYGVTTLAITGLFALLIGFADLIVWRYNVDARSPIFSVAFLVFAILAFNPLRNRLQTLVDRTFDRDRAGYRRAVREISDAMVSMLSIKEVVDRILVACTDTMGVERALVLLLDEDKRALAPVASRGDWDAEVLETEIPSDHPILKQLWMRREELTRLDFSDESDPEVRDACRDLFDTLEVKLLVPVLFGVDLIGVIAVGGKLTGERMSADDRQLLRTLANQSSIAIENAKAFDEIAQLNETLEARVEERTDELRMTQAQLIQNEKMVSLGQLVAGVAHELNNPIGFVHANLQLIEDYTEKLLGQTPADSPQVVRMREALQKLFTRSREGTTRVKQIVMDLRAFSRLDQAEVLEADLHEGIDRTLSLMEPRLKEGIEVVRDYGDLPPVRCHAGQLNQVFMNLLTNACDALDDQGTIRITTRTTENGVRLEFADDGPGIPPEIQNRLFEPFFTTKGVGKGSGLGLSLSHGIVERHGGRITVESKPGRGARFAIELPLAAPEAEA